VSASKRLLVEGNDDEHVLKHVWDTLSLPYQHQIVRFDGVDELLVKMPVLLLESDIEVVGIVLDADTNFESRWNSVRGRLISSGYQQVPTMPTYEGTVISPPANTLLPVVGVWIMPDNASDGILEDFLKQLIPQNSLLFKHVEQSVDSIPADLRRFRDIARPKVLIHTWLAWQEVPGQPYGTAIKSKYLDPESDAAKRLSEWMRTLFA